MITLENLQEQLKLIIEQREQTQQMFHRLSGAMQVLEGQIKSLEEKDDSDGKVDDESPSELTEG